MRKTALFGVLVCLVLGGEGCGTPSVGIGYGIPGTPISVGGSVPVGRPVGAKSKSVVWRPLRVESIPDGAEVYVNNELAGSTPLDAQLPFEKGFFGGAKGSVQLILKKKGFLPEGERLFPSPGGHVTRTEDGAAVGKMTFHLRKE